MRSGKHVIDQQMAFDSQRTRGKDAVCVVVVGGRYKKMMANVYVVGMYDVVRFNERHCEGGIKA